MIQAANAVGKERQGSMHRHEIHPASLEVALLIAEHSADGSHPIEIRSLARLVQEDVIDGLDVPDELYELEIAESVARFEESRVV